MFSAGVFFPEFLILFGAHLIFSCSFSGFQAQPALLSMEGEETRTEKTGTSVRKQIVCDFNSVRNSLFGFLKR